MIYFIHIIQLWTLDIEICIKSEYENIYALDLVWSVNWVSEPQNHWKNKDENVLRYAVRGGKERERERDKKYDTKRGQKNMT